MAIALRNKEHPQRLKAAEMVLNRAHGLPKASSASYDIISAFIAGDISAIEACLMMESEGLKVPTTLQAYFDNQVEIAKHEPFNPRKFSLDNPPKELPRR